MEFWVKVPPGRPLPQMSSANKISPKHFNKSKAKQGTLPKHASLSWLSYLMTLIYSVSGLRPTCSNGPLLHSKQCIQSTLSKSWRMSLKGILVHPNTVLLLSTSHTWQVGKSLRLWARQDSDDISHLTSHPETPYDFSIFSVPQKSVVSSLPNRGHSHSAATVLSECFLPHNFWFNLDLQAPWSQDMDRGFFNLAALMLTVAFSPVKGPFPRILQSPIYDTRFPLATPSLSVLSRRQVDPARKPPGSPCSSDACSQTAQWHLTNPWNC